MLRLSFISVILLVLLSIEWCSKAPGLGGKASIKGKLTGRFYTDNELTMFAGLGALGDENVYIIYGNEQTFYSDDISTSYDGSFEFSYLRPGKYVVFMYENCYPCAALQQEKLFEVEITEKNQVVDLGEIILNKEQ